MPSFDVVCRVEQQEVQNAVNNASSEIANRYDFRDTDTEIRWEPAESHFVIESDAEGRVRAAWDVLQSHLVRRNVSLKGIAPGPVELAGGSRQRRIIEVQQGVPHDVAKEMVKAVKDSRIKKVQGSIQGDQVRFSGKKRDDLQSVIALIREEDYGLPLSFVNFRD